MKIEFLREVGSTNDYIRQYLGGSEDVVVCAERQTAGRGTKGRSFLSERGGVYLSALTFYRMLPASETFRIMTHAAVAVSRTVCAFGAEPEIKWPNDVFVNGRKICGILIENVLSDGFVKASVVGIGLNVENDLKGLETAITLEEACGSKVAVSDVREKLIENLQKNDTFGDYLCFVKFLGHTVNITEGEETYSARAVRILPDGRLEVDREGARRILSAAEIGMRLS